MPRKVEPYDSAKHFTDAQAQQDLLADAAQMDDPAYAAHAADIVSRARQAKPKHKLAKLPPRLASLPPRLKSLPPLRKGKD